MITVLSVNKQGNKILSYTCTDGRLTMELSKEQLIKHIDKGNVLNARIQRYSGKVIIRVSSDVARCNTKNKILQNKKEESNENNIISYIEKAKNNGIRALELDGIVVNTTTLQIRKVNKQNSSVCSINSYESSIHKVVEKLLNIQEYAVKKLGIKDKTKFKWSVFDGINSQPHIYVTFSSGHTIDYIPNSNNSAISALDCKEHISKMLSNTRESDGSKIENIDCLLIDFDAGGDCYVFIHWNVDTDKYSLYEARGNGTEPFNKRFKEATDMFHLTNMKYDTEFTYEEMIEHIYKLSIT